MRVLFYIGFKNNTLVSPMENYKEEYKRERNIPSDLTRKLQRNLRRMLQRNFKIPCGGLIIDRKQNSPNLLRRIEPESHYIYRRVSEANTNI